MCTSVDIFAASTLVIAFVIYTDAEATMVVAEGSSCDSRKILSKKLSCEAPASISASNSISIQHTKLQKKKQYVLFVGNLPFSATKDDIMQHFNRTGK
jgi:hypothetical protein